jgi:hypothetical protein
MTRWRFALLLAGTLVLLGPFSFSKKESARSDGWILVRSETFDGSLELKDGVAFGDGGWLIPTIRRSGRITIDKGYAHFETADFRDSALLRITDSLPAEYKIRVKLGQVHYNISNYTDADFNTPGFKYNRHYLENGFYWLTLTDRAVEESSGEDWWHRYRKIVVDSDDHIGQHLPVYMVYMNPGLGNPDMDRNSPPGDWIGGKRDLLRSWSGGRWHTEPDNWEAAFHYDENAWYVVEVEKAHDNLVLRALDAAGKVIEETDPVPLDLIYAMGRQASPLEYAYVGEPHIDSYKGDALVDEIQLFVPASHSQVKTKP